MKQNKRFIIVFCFLILSLNTYALTTSQSCPSADYLEKIYQYTIQGVVIDNYEGQVLIQITELNFTPESPYQQLGVYTEELYYTNLNGTLLLKSQPIAKGTHIFAYADKQIGDSAFNLGSETCALTITKEPVNVSGSLMLIIILLLIGAGIYYVKKKE